MNILLILTLALTAQAYPHRSRSKKEIRKTNDCVDPESLSIRQLKKLLKKKRRDARRLRTPAVQYWPDQSIDPYFEPSLDNEFEFLHDYPNDQPVRFDFTGDIVG
ncbi:Oidioi.mRNA.OKI2018_I69.PAR.g11783.t1.cds [Oikopleura dioica]|uniref:Oidioi.mRNA.OKI2018_I69.PAR.g11783.t1.cds n=1 Tax=Oikopleura dioica TaxID=34765 RepID=A0ABN7S088_OIKDI|nr:Oidioi.mRNA.OKI2018_I69.PAR.g11783.t1.cds [Oikopleura dioica]